MFIVALSFPLLLLYSTSNGQRTETENLSTRSQTLSVTIIGRVGIHYDMAFFSF